MINELLIKLIVASGGTGLIKVENMVNNATDPVTRIVNTLCVLALVFAGGWMLFNKEKGKGLAITAIIASSVIWLANNGFLTDLLTFYN